jgi:hypothetical protein
MGCGKTLKIGGLELSYEESKESGLGSYLFWFEDLLVYILWDV